jgi:trehalose 6-phosphate phosphatase
MDAMAAALGATMRTATVADPLGRPVEARFALFDGGRRAIVETAEASGLRLVAEDERDRVREVVERMLAERPDDLKVTPGKMVYELQPRIDWDKGRAVLHLLEALHLDRDDVVPLYFGDDITDEHAFQALAGRGIGIFVGDPDDPEVAGRTTAADFSLASIDEVEQLLDSLAR